MATPITDIAAFLDDYLRIREIPDEVNAINGLQIENRSGGVARVVAAVDASQATIAGVVRENGEIGHGGGTLLIVHHGLFWGGNLPVIGGRFNKIQTLINNDIAVYSAHIPLDIHAECGNNVLLAQALGLTETTPFAAYRGVAIGASGTLEMPRDQLIKALATLLHHPPLLIAGGPEITRRVGIITGGAGTSLHEAHRAGIDTYITGEGPHHTFHDAMELGINLIYAGHYATEQSGVQALAALLGKRFQLPFSYHDHPTGL